MEYFFIALSVSFLILGGSFINSFELINRASGVFSIFIGITFILASKFSSLDNSITIKSTEKLELIETITTTTDTIYKYQVINK